MTPNQKAGVTLGSLVLGVLLADRWLRRRALGQAVLGPVYGTTTTYDDEDRRQEALSGQYRAALSLLAVDLDLMEPTRRPTPDQLLLLEQTAKNLDASGRADDAKYLRGLTREALQLPVPRGVA